MTDLSLGLAWFCLFTLCGTAVALFALAAMGMDSSPSTGPSRNLLFDVPVARHVTLSVAPIASFGALTEALDAIRRLPEVQEARAVDLRAGTGVFEAEVALGAHAPTLAQSVSQQLGARVTV